MKTDKERQVVGGENMPQVLKYSALLWLAQFPLMLLACLSYYWIPWSDTKTIESPSKVTAFRSASGSGSNYQETYRLESTHYGFLRDVSLSTLLGISAVLAVVGWRIRKVQTENLLPWSIFALAWGSFFSVIYIMVLFRGSSSAVIMLGLLAAVLLLPGVLLLINNHRYKQYWRQKHLGSVTLTAANDEALQASKIRCSAILLMVYGLLCIFIAVMVFYGWVGQTMQVPGNPKMVGPRPVLYAKITTTNSISWLSTLYQLHQNLSPLSWTNAVFTWSQGLAIAFGSWLLCLGWSLLRLKLLTLRFVQRISFWAAIGWGIYGILSFFLAFPLFMSMPNMLFPGGLLLLLVWFLLRKENSNYKALRDFRMQTLSETWMKQKGIKPPRPEMPPTATIVR